MNVCLWSPGWSTAGASAADAAPSTHELATSLAGLAPRLRVERELIWADGQGLDAVALARRLLERVVEDGVVCRAGVAAVPVTAELAARWGGEEEASEATTFLVKERTGWGRRAPSTPSSSSADRSPGPASPDLVVGEGAAVVVERGGERAWQAGLPVLALQPDDRVRSLLEGVGIRTVGALASLEREAVEVRFGGGAVSLWRRARADDRRLLFDRIPPERPHGSMDFVDYVLTDPSRLLFTANALLGPICDGLTGRGEHARTLRLELPLANGETWDRTLRPARPTASRETWLRMIRALLDRLTVPDAVAGMRLEVPSTEAAAVRQGDLFDRGFATASAVEAAVARLAEREVWPVVPESGGHPLVERRGGWKRQSVASVPRLSNRRRSEGADAGHTAAGQRPDAHDAPGTARPGDDNESGLTLQLLPEPRRIRIETTLRRDHEVPVRLRDRRGWRDVLLAAGPDRISGGRWEASSYAREYYRCVTEEGVPLWIYRDALDGAWYLHGWWD
jgi:nucleotidyltransferase/DNA polymerase involved in DNA repair